VTPPACLEGCRFRWFCRYQEDVVPARLLPSRALREFQLFGLVVTRDGVEQLATIARRLRVLQLVR
jgi:hypothetical protein